ncbi:MAG TPA: LPS export ABC transporter periplasmic protein LptC [Longimicrobiales bacterium]|nr:LPS export ABC transporter periplasmic protein LptC [Longimicrobiales bacterium]
MSGRVYVAAMLILALAACRGVTDEPTGDGYQDLRSDKIMIDATHNATNNGVRSAIGQYDTVYVFDDSTVYHVKGVNLQTFDVDGRHSSTITADSGSLNQATDALIARGSVVLVTENLCTIRTEELNYDPGTRQLWSELPTRFEWDGRITTADRFRADDGFRNINATNVRGQMPSGC